MPEEGDPLELERFVEEFSQSWRIDLAAPGWHDVVLHSTAGLVESWAWGYKSACDVQAEAEAEFNDQKNLSKTLKISVDFGFASLKQLAGFGHDGT